MDPQRLQKQSRGEGGGSIMRKKEIDYNKNITSPLLEHLLKRDPLIWQKLIHEEPYVP